LAVKEWGKKTPSFSQFEEAIGQVESTLIGRFKGLREHGLEPSFDMVLASADQIGRASIYLFDGRGLAEPVHDDPGFAVIGTGFYASGNLLLRLLSYDPEGSYVLDMGALSTFLIDIISKVDPAVGPFAGESYYIRVENGEVLVCPLKEKAIKEYKEKARQRKELIRRMWRFFNAAGELELDMKIEEIEEKFE